MVESLEREIRELRSLYWHPRRDPHGRAFAPLADAYRRAGQQAQALEALEDGLGRIPAFATGHLVSAWLHRDLGDPARAESSFRRVLELDAENARALIGLGRLQVAAGRIEAGRELVRRALELDPLLEAEETLPESLTRAVAEVPPGAEAAAEVTAEAQEVILTLEDLAPDVDEDADEVILSLDGLAPEGDDGEQPAPEPTASVPKAAVEAAEGPLPTRTLAELYARQGLLAEALAVYHQLAAAAPDDGRVRTRMAELRAEIDTEADSAPEGDSAQEVDSARDVDSVREAEAAPASGRSAPEPEHSRHDEHLPAAPEPSPDAPTPFGWAGGAGSDEEGREPAPPVGDYFSALLAWGDRRDPHSGTEE